MRLREWSRRAPAALLLAGAALFSSGCFTQRPAGNALSRADLPPEAKSGFVIDVHGYQADGLKAAWREGDRVFVIADRTRIGPREGTPFGQRPNDPQITVLESDAADYHDVWHQAALFNMWFLPPWDIGILQSETTYSTFRWYHALLYWSEAGEEKTHRGELGFGQNSPIFRDHLHRTWEQGFEYLERYLGTRETRAVYLFRDPDGSRRSIALERESEGELLTELRTPQPSRRAAAAVLLGHLAGSLSPVALEGVLGSVELGEPDVRVKSFLHWAIGQFYGVGNFDLAIAERIAAMPNRAASEELRQYLLRTNPGSVLLLGSALDTPPLRGR